MRKLVPSTAFAVATVLALTVATAALAAFTSVVSGNPSPVAACTAPAAGGTSYINAARTR
jgi:hypothetical protein